RGAGAVVHGRRLRRHRARRPDRRDSAGGAGELALPGGELRRRTGGLLPGGGDRTPAEPGAAVRRRRPGPVRGDRRQQGAGGGTGADRGDAARHGDRDRRRHRPRRACEPGAGGVAVRPLRGRRAGGRGGRGGRAGDGLAATGLAGVRRSPGLLPALHGGPPWLAAADRALAPALQVEDRAQHGVDDDHFAVDRTPVAVATVVAVLVAALEALAEVVVVLGAADVVADVAEAGVDPHHRAAVSAAPAVVAVGATG